MPDETPVLPPDPQYANVPPPPGQTAQSGYWATNPETGLRVWVATPVDFQ